MTSNTIAVAEDLAFTLLENSAENALQLLAHRLEINMLVCSAVIARCHYVNHCIVVIITTEWSINTHVMVVGLDGLVDFGFLHLGNLAQFSYRWLALVLLFELADFCLDLTQSSNLVEGKANNTALLSDSLQNALTNPPYCVGDKLKTTSLIKLLCSLHQTDITLINQVGKTQTLMLVLLGNRYNKSKIGFYQFLLGTLSLTASLAYFLGKFYLFIDRDHRFTTNLYQIFVECFTGAVGNTFTDLKLSHKSSFYLDVFVLMIRRKIAIP